MNFVKCIGFLILAVALLSALAAGGIFIIFAGIAIGLIVSVGTAVLLLAANLKSYFDAPSKKAKSN